MPVVRPRGHNKRSSSSYGPTLILAAFVVLCVVGGWKLTSNNSIKIPLARISSDSNSGRKDKHVFEDNPGDLPDDVVKVDGQIPVRDNDGEEKKPVELPEDSKDSSVDIEKLKEEGSVVEENAKDSELKESLEEAEKQREGESQVSEGGSVAHDQGQEQTGQEGSESQDNKNVEEQESRGDQDVEKEGEKDPLSSSDSRETAEKNEDQISSSESNEKVQDDQQQEDHNVQEDSELEDTRRKNEQGDGGNQDIGKEKDEEQRSSRESNENAQEIEEKGASEDEHDSMSQQQERSEENKKSEDMNKQASEAEELIRQRQEDAGIVQDSLQESHNETSLGGDEHHQEMSSSISSDKPHENVSGSHEFQDETSSALATNKRKKKHKKGSKHKQQTKATVAGSVQEEYQQKEGSNSDTMVEDKLSKPEKDDSESRGQSIKASKESTEPENTWSSQASESKHQKDRHSDDKNDTDQQSWQLCNVTAGPDYIPCLDNVEALKHVRITGHYEHRERHCPEKPPTCLVPLPNGYKTPVQWPASRDKIWYNNVPHPMLAGVKGHQNWVKVMGEFLTFPGGGTQFIHGALLYIQYVEESESKIAWGKHTRVILDVGCGVASFGGFLFEKDVLAMSFAPKDEHEAQVQFALERGIPAISAVMGSQRLPYPSNVFDLLHCARCRVPWHREGGMLLLELNRVLRPGGYFVWSATPVYQNLEEDVAIWKDMESLTKSMCWKLVSITKDKLNSIGAAIYQKPSSNECYDQRTENSPPMCENDDDPNAAWYIPLQACIHRLPEKAAERGSHWPESWPLRLQTPPYWLDNSQKGIYGKPAQEDFAADYEQWKELVKESYMDKLGFNWSSIRNVLDMRSVYGGFAAALRDLKLWVMNIVNVDSADTLPIIYERGLLGMYHDWCESFSTYPRTYDLLHADNLFSRLKTRCKTIVPAVVEVDRIVRPGGKLIIRDEPDTIKEVENLLKSLQWKVLSSLSKDQYHILSAEKSFWRPNNYAASS